MLLQVQRAYQQLATILGFPGTESLAGIQNEAVPVQELTRVLQDSRVKRTLFQITGTPAATDTVDLQWSDVSDWTQVLVDGVIQTTDAALPQRNETRLIVGASLQVAGTQANYTTSQVLRRTATTVPQNVLVREWGAIVAGQPNASPIAPSLLPMPLPFEENTVRWQRVVSGAAAAMSLTVEMISSTRGVLHPVPGV